jgi:hypothetical protein
MFLLISSMSNILSARNHMQIEYCGNVHPGLERSTRELKYLNQNILSARMLLLVVLILWLKLPSMWFSSLVYPRLQDTASTTMPGKCVKSEEAWLNLNIRQIATLKHKQHQHLKPQTAERPCLLHSRYATISRLVPLARNIPEYRGFLK